MAYKIPFVDHRKNYRMIRDEIDAAYFSVMEAGDDSKLCLRDFEEHLAAFVGVKYAVGVNSGYDALHISLRAAGVKPGDEVIVPAHAFVASCSAIVNVGAIPVLVDVRDDFNIDPDLVEAAITERTRGVMPAHLNGAMADMSRIMDIARKHDLLVVEDACLSLGAAIDGVRAGSWGNAGCWNFRPFKLPGSWGDGGAITTNDKNIADMAAFLRNNGEDVATGEYRGHGFSAMLDNIQAAWLDIKLRRLPAWIERRRAIAAQYRAGLEGIGDLTSPHPSPDHVYQNYVIMTPRRDELATFLKQQSIEVLAHWPIPYYRHPALNLTDRGFPVAERICRTVLSLPLNVEIEDGQVAYVIEKIKDFFAR